MEMCVTLATIAVEGPVVPAARSVPKAINVSCAGPGPSRKPTASRFRAGDGYIVLAVLTEKQFVNLMKALGRPDVLADPRFKDWPSRTENEPALREIIEAAMAIDDPRTWETRLTAADVPCGSIWKVHEIVRHPQLEHRDVLQTIDDALQT